MNYLHNDNKDKPFVDWRQAEYRMEGFMRWLKWRMKYSDLDHYATNNAYRDHFGMDKEQRYWFATIFGMTYQSEMAWVIFNHFPDFGSIDMVKLDIWNRSSMPIMKYAKDCKYNKGHIVSQVESIKRIVEPFGSLTKFYESFITDDEHETFEALYDAVKCFHKFGRMTTWITLQVLFETADLPCRPNTMLSYDPSSWSVRSGIMYLYNREDKIEATHDDVTITEEDVAWLKIKEVELFNACKEYLGADYEEIFSHYLLESHLCQYKKLMLGGDYAGHSSCDHISRAKWLGERWPNVSFFPFFDNVMNKLYYHKVIDKEENKVLRNLTKITGQMINMDELYLDMPDMYKELGIKLDDVSNEPNKLKLMNSAMQQYITGSMELNLFDLE